MRRRTIGSLAVRLGSIAATILALAGVTVLMTQGGGRVALVQVLDKVKEADSVEFVIVPVAERSPKSRTSASFAVRGFAFSTQLAS